MLTDPKTLSQALFFSCFCIVILLLPRGNGAASLALKRGCFCPPQFYQNYSTNTVFNQGTSLQ